MMVFHRSVLTFLQTVVACNSCFLEIDRSLSQWGVPVERMALACQV